MSPRLVDDKAAAEQTARGNYCGYCGGRMPEQWRLRLGRCPCGRRHISSLATGVVLVHKEGCSGGNCDCGNIFN